jgi:hexulose-6-phosphate isomerase
MFSTLSSDTAKKLSLKEKFQLLKDAGFDGVEVMSAMNQQEVLAARDATGLEIPSLDHRHALVASPHFAESLGPRNHGRGPQTRSPRRQGLRLQLRAARAGRGQQGHLLR